MDEREAVERLRAADPAASAQPDEERLRAALENRGAPVRRTADGAGRATVPDELAARRSRRLLPVAAAVVAALAVGTAGYAVGRNAEPAPPPAAEPAVLSAPNQLRAMARPEAMAAIDIGYGGGGRMSFTASGLSGAGGSATVWAFDGASAYDAQTAARAAAALGLEGEPRLEEGGSGWVVGTPDGSGAFLNLMPDGTATVSYHDPELYSLIEEVVPLPAPDVSTFSGDGATSSDSSGPAGGGLDGVLGEPEVVEPAEPALPTEGEEAVDGDQGVGGPEPDLPGTDPGTEEPIALPEVLPAPEVVPDPAQGTIVAPDGQAPEGAPGVVYEVLAALGLDPEAVEYETGEHWAGGEVGVVTAHLLVAGERSGTSWYAEITDDRVMSFSGPLAPVVELGEYDVVGPAAAVERLSDPRFGHSDYRIAAGTMMVPEVGRPWGTPPAEPPAPGTPVPWQVREVTITGAELMLTMTTTEDGVTLLVPAYSMSDSEGGSWTVVALAEHELAF